MRPKLVRRAVDRPEVRLKMRAYFFGDGPRGWFTHGYRSEVHPEIELRIHGRKGTQPFRQWIIHVDDRHEEAADAQTAINLLERLKNRPKIIRRGKPK